VTMSQVLRRTGAAAAQDVDQLGFPFPLTTGSPSQQVDGRTKRPPETR
jgi:hypothetical protein